MRYGFIFFELYQIVIHMLSGRRDAYEHISVDASIMYTHLDGSPHDIGQWWARDDCTGDMTILYGPSIVSCAIVYF